MAANRRPKVRRKNRVVRRPRRVLPTNIIQMKRSYQGKTLTTNGAGFCLDSQSFSLAAVSNASELTALFEFYRICAVAVTFSPNYAAQMGNTAIGNLHYCIDTNDSTTPGGLSDIQQYPSYKMVPLSKPHTVYLKPRCADTYYQGTLASGYGMSAKGAWLDCKSSGINYYGLKYVVDNTQLSAGIASTYITLYLQLKGVS